MALLPSDASQDRRSLSADSHTPLPILVHPSSCPLCLHRSFMPGYWGGLTKCPEPLCYETGVTGLAGDVRHHLRGRYPSFIALTGSCASPKPSCSLWLLALFGRSLQVAVSPCWEWDFPDVSSACLSPRAWTPIPAALEVHLPVSSLEASAFPPLGRVGAQRLIHALRLRHGPTFGSAVIPLCSGPRFCSPPRSLLPLDNPAVQGSRDLLRPSRTRFVTSSCIGYASRLNRVIAGRGLSPH